MARESHSLGYATPLRKSTLGAALQLLAWVMFCPTAWRKYTSVLGLRSGFSIAELTREQWRDPAIRRLVYCASVSWPLVGLCALLFEILTVFDGWNLSDWPLLLGALVGVAFSISGCVGAGLGVVWAAAFSMIVEVAAGGRRWASPLGVGAFAGVVASITYPLLDRSRGGNAFRQAVGLLVAIAASNAVLWASSVPLLVAPTLAVILPELVFSTPVRVVATPWLATLALLEAVITFGAVRVINARAFNGTAALTTGAAVGLLIVRGGIAISGAAAAASTIGVACGVSLAIGLATSPSASASRPRLASRLLGRVVVGVLCFVIFLALARALTIVDRRLLSTGVVAALSSLACAMWLPSQHASRPRIIGLTWVVAIVGVMLTYEIAPLFHFAVSEDSVTPYGVPFAMATGIMYGLSGSDNHQRGQFLGNRVGRLTIIALAAYLVSQVLVSIAAAGSVVFWPTFGSLLPTFAFAKEEGLQYVLIASAPFVLLKHYGAPKLTSIALALAIAVVPLALLQRSSPTFHLYVGWAAAGTLLGLMQPLWRSLLLYPSIRSSTRGRQS